jgi:hypothetical protein
MKTNDSKQVAAFEKLVGYCNNFGAMYNPSKASMKVTALNTLLTSAQQSLQAVKNAQNAFTLAINVRQDSFNTLPKLCTRIINALEATDAPPSLITDAKIIRTRFRSRTKESKPSATPAVVSSTPAPPAQTPRGPISQLDYESRISNFYALIQLLSSEPSYKPNEVDLQIASLNTLLTGLRDKNKTVMTTQVALSNARLNRKKLMFDTTGVYGTGKMVKKYISSVYGTTSDQYRQVQRLKFVK